MLSKFFIFFLFATPYLHTTGFKLITSLYNEKNQTRCNEYLTCLEKNINHPSIDEISILYDISKDDGENAFLHTLKSKIKKTSKPTRIYFIKERPTYGDCFSLANTSYPNSRIILCNADIYFNDTLKLLDTCNLTNTFIGLTRWNVLADGSLELFKQYHRDGTFWKYSSESSQDAWIFQTPLKRFNNQAIQLGTMHCDSLIAYQAAASGLQIFNPCLSVQCCHLHLSNVRNYDNRVKHHNLIKTIEWITIEEMQTLQKHTKETFNEAQQAPAIIDYITIAILAKDKAHALPMYLACIEKQTWPTKQTYLYIRTNNNNDNTTEILHQWIEKVQGRYAGIYCDDSDVVEPVQNYKQHEWNNVRFKVLGKIRQDSVIWAYNNKSHYFVADCDNFIAPHTLEALMHTNLPIVAPLLHVGQSKESIKLGISNVYANYHADVDKNGYYADTPLYYQLFKREIQGLVEVPVVHCTYLIRYEALNQISYDDASNRYEYVIFSDSARKQNIPQYIDTREIYGHISFAENAEQLYKESWTQKITPLNSP